MNDQRNNKNAKPRKVAIIRAFLPGERAVDATGCGRSTRRAASRALLNLLGHRLLRRQRLIAVQIELTITNASRDPRRGEFPPGRSA